MNSFEIYSRLNLIFYQPSDLLTARGITDFLLNVVEHPSYRDDMLEFIDLSYVKKWDIQYDDIQAILTSQTDSGIKAKKVSKTGILAPSDISYGIARMYQTMAQSYGGEIFISRRKDAVLDFLELSDQAELAEITAR